MRGVDWIAEKGAPTDKLVLGIPLYCRGLADPSYVQTYAEVYKELGREKDTTKTVWCNSPLTAANKARLAGERGLAGVFLWEIGQDVWNAPGVPSLTEVVGVSLAETMAKIRGEPPPSLPQPP